jgi:hypothetical protein
MTRTNTQPQPATDPVMATLDKLERVYADMGLRVTEQETVPAARAAHAAMGKALDYMGQLLNPPCSIGAEGEMRLIVTRETYEEARAAYRAARGAK